MLYLAVSLALAAVVLGVLAFRESQAHAALKLPARPITQVAPGMVHVTGRVVPVGATLESPKLGRECVYYRSRVEVRRPVQVVSEQGNFSVGVGVGYQTSVESSEEDWVPFAVEDATGTVLIDPARARFILQRDLEVGETKTEEGWTSADFDAEAGHHQHHHHASRRVTRMEVEKIIEPGDLVRVVGQAREEAPPPEVDASFTIGKAGSTLFLITDRPIGGVLSNFSNRTLVYGFTAGLLALSAVLCVGISRMPSPEDDPIIPDTRLRPIERGRRP